MKRYLIAVVVAAVLGAAQMKNPEAALGAARHMEEADGNYPGAIEAYKKFLAQYGKDRALAAKALVRMGECYEKLGDAEARKAYERVVREYGDQKEAVTTALARLGRPEAGMRKATSLVWSGPKVDTEGTVSPDGRYLSYTDWDTGDLAVHEIATGHDRHLTDTKNRKQEKWQVFAEESAISRDSKQVSYSWYNSDNGKHYELRLASLTGEPNPHRLYDNPAVDWLAPTDWSPDGKWVAVLIALKDKSDQIGLVSVADGTLRVLKAGKWRGSCRIFFSPDGKYIGYDLPQGDSGPDRDVFVMALDGTGEIPAVVHRGPDMMMGWSPDGKRLLFASDRTGSMALWSLAFTDGKPQGQPEMIKPDLGQVEPMGVTRSGALYYGVRTGALKSSIQVASLDFVTGKLLSPPRDITRDYLESNSQPNWSPDGKYLAYVSVRGRGGRDNTFLVIRSAETLQVIRELQTDLYYNIAGWAPDGRSLLIQGYNSQDRRGTFRIDAQTGDIATVLLDRPDQEWPRGVISSADGKSIYFVRSVSGNKEIAFVRRDLTSGGVEELIRRPVSAAGPSLGSINLSPDGQYGATFSVEPSTNSRVMLLIPVAGGEPRVAARVASEVEPAQLRTPGTGVRFGGVIWVADSRSFLTFKWFPRESHKAREVWRVPIDGSDPRKLDWDLDKSIPGGASLQPGGRQLVWAVNESGSKPTREVWVLENFLPAPGVSK